MRFSFRDGDLSFHDEEDFVEKKTHDRTDDMNAERDQSLDGRTPPRDIARWYNMRSARRSPKTTIRPVRATRSLRLALCFGDADASSHDPLASSATRGVVANLASIHWLI